MIPNVDQLAGLVRREIGRRLPESYLHRVDQRTCDAAASPVHSPLAAVSGEHGPDEDVVHPMAAYHVRDECVPCDQAHVVRHLITRDWKWYQLYVY